MIEDVHTPLNLAYLTFTTGTSAFQNIVGVTYAELPARIRASVRILERAGLKCGDKLLVTYPPLVNVFSGQALKDFGLKWSFLVRSSVMPFWQRCIKRGLQLWWVSLRFYGRH